MGERERERERGKAALGFVKAADGRKDVALPFEKNYIIVQKASYFFHKYNESQKSPRRGLVKLI